MDIVPPKQIFQQAPQGGRERHEIGTYDLAGFIAPTRSENGGMMSWFQGHPYPRKGFIYAEGVIATNKIKRVTLALFLPFADLKKGFKGFINSYLRNYIRLVDGLMTDYTRIPYLKFEYYCEFSKATWIFTSNFLQKLWVEEEIAEKIGMFMATIFENDDAYRLRPMDLLSETTKELLLRNPRGELKRLAFILRQRDPTMVSGEEGAGGRVEKVLKVLSYLLWLPPIKKAFKYALEKVDFKWFQYDIYEYYWSLNRFDYNPKGRSFEERKEEQIKLMMEYAEKTTGLKAERVEQPDGSINIVTHAI